MFNKLVGEIIAQVPVYCGSGWLDDANYYFCENPSLIQASARETVDPTAMLLLKASADEHFKTLLEIRSLQYSIWNKMNFSYFSATSHDFYKEAAVLRFITMANRRSCLTGRMIIGGPNYDALLTKQEQLGKRPVKASLGIDFQSV